ncbi:PREDICTED: uncharacterized protein LOC104803188 [Tarenaya hassleriana]|uniref:uncharacterized protein LOC104803188 n=1 Tax=Tarenaya hassleriana TaxID=28532 RepID=UPI00053CA303|nr:PREDICTED: uncharacterized protein LOC104803188 [Tarenaya hassleriana]XP_010525383.1 PREDICTED: uncharacterized protein LOC104803188 [Tarenaya hassleriana]XP_010525393.1 PREDICTED: uncharacterized protein LOC104803188 [Tarenaya hassleriana]
MLKRGNRVNGSCGPQTYKLALLMLVGVFGIAVWLLCFSGKNQGTKFPLPKQISSSIKPRLQFHPTVEFQNGTDVIWQIPSSPKAVLFIAHGCQRRATDFWDRSLECPKCIGLPEETVLVLHALARKFAVIAVSSAGRCWTFGEERLIVQNIISTWVSRHKLERLPLVALGASSGGYFVSALATDMRFSSIVLMIAEGVFDRISITKRYPPTFFVHMPKDVHRQQKIREYRDGLEMQGIDVEEIECLDLPLSPNFLADRIRGVDQVISAKLFKVFQEKGFIDEKGYMRRDGRRTRWKEALHDYKISLDKSLFTHVEEELNLAFAYHEMTSLQSEQIFKWFESHMS